MSKKAQILEAAERLPELVNRMEAMAAEFRAAAEEFRSGAVQFHQMTEQNVQAQPVTVEEPERVIQSHPGIDWSSTPSDGDIAPLALIPQISEQEE